MTEKETDQNSGQEAEENNKQKTEDASDKQQDQQDGSLNDKEMATLLLNMEVQLCRLCQEAAYETYSSKLDSLLAGFIQNFNDHRRNLRDLITRHGWVTPEAAKREDYETVIRKFEGTAPPAV